MRPAHRLMSARWNLVWGSIFCGLVQAYADGAISLEQLSASVRGWVNHTRYANTVGLRKALLTTTTIPAPPKKKVAKGV